MKELNEKDKLQDMLSGEKELVKVYGGFITEASITPLRDLFKNHMFEASCDQFQIYNAMSDRNYYQVKKAQQTDIDNAITKFGKSKSEL